MTNSKKSLRTFFNDNLIHKLSYSSKVISKYYIKNIFGINKQLSILKNLKDTKKNCDALLIANGPSARNLNENKVKELQDKGCLDIFCLNSWINDNEECIYYPDYYVLADQIYFDSPLDEEWYEKNDRREITKIVKAEKEVIYKIKQKCKIFAPQQFIHYTKQYNKDCEIIPFCNSVIKIGQIAQPYKPSSFYPMTALHMLNIARYMGYKNIYIIGFDNNQYRTFSINLDGTVQSKVEYAGNRITTLNNHIEYNGMVDVFYELHEIHKSFNKFSKFNIKNLDYSSELSSFIKADPLCLMK
tara:strand:- start:883 stop:1782 length:900 start_codon:yes stop_codon:yes gene_type:complete